MVQMDLTVQTAASRFTRVDGKMFAAIALEELKIC